MFDGLELAAPEPVKAPEAENAGAGDAPVSAFSFLNSDSTELKDEDILPGQPIASPRGEEEENNDESLLDLNMPVAGTVDVFSLIDTQPEAPVSRRPIVKKKRGKKVGYEREDNESPARPSIEDSSPALNQTEEEHSPEKVSETEAPTEEVKEQVTVPEYVPNQDEGTKPKKSGVLRRMFGPKRSKDSLVTGSNKTDDLDASTPPSSPQSQQKKEEAKITEEEALSQDEDVPEKVTTDDKDTADVEATAQVEDEVPTESKEDEETKSIEEKSEVEEEVIEVPKKLPGEELAEKMDEFVRGTTDLCFRLSEHERRAARVAREREELAGEQASFEAELKAKVKEQEAYAEAEEYERADELSTAVERAKQEMALRAAALRDLALEVDRDEREMQQRRRDRLKAVDELKKWLTQFETAQREAVRIATTEAAQRREAAARRVTAEAERLAMERAHVDRDKDHVAEEFERIEKLIQNQTLPYASKRTELAEAKATKDTEIHELRSRLEILESERAMIENELAATDESIDLARSKFERPLQRLKQREVMLQESAADCEAELQALEREKDAIAQAAIDAKEAAHTQSRLAALAATELAVADQLADTARIWEVHTPALDDKQDTFSENAEANGNTISVQALQVAVAEAEESSHEARRQLQKLESKRTALSKERKRLEDDLPQLEASKKAAAAARNYKEAGALAKQAKALASKRDELDAALLDLTTPLDAAQELADARARDHAEAKANLADRERASVVEQYKALRKKQRDLERARRTFAKRESASKLASAAKDLAKVELSTVATKADDLVREQNLTDLPPESDLSEEEEEEEEDEAPMETSVINASTEKPPVVTSTLLDTEEEEKEEASSTLPDSAQVENELIPQSIDSETPPTELNAPSVEEDVPVAEDEEKVQNESEMDPEERRKKEEEREALRSQLESSIAKIEADIDAAVECDDFDSADALATQVDELKAQLNAL